MFDHLRSRNLNYGLSLDGLILVGSGLSVTLALAIGTVVIYRLLFHPLRKIPGPWPAKVTELWRTRRYMLGNWHEDIIDLHRKYGSVVKISPNEVSIVDKDALVALYGNSTSSTKTSWYDTWSVDRDAPSFFNVTDVKHHAFMRRRVAGVYSMTAILRMEPRIQRVADAMWERFHEFERAGSTVDLAEWANYFAFDVVGMLATEQPLGFIKSGSDSHGLIASIHSYFWLSSNLGYLPGQTRLVFHPVLRALNELVGSGNGLNHFTDMLVALMTRRRSDPKKNIDAESKTTDLLDHFMSMKAPDGGTAPDKEILTEAGNLIGAGADTTAIGIASVLGQLLLHPESYAEVKNEIDVAVAAARLKDSEVGPRIPFSIAGQLPYLNACVKEALRLHPSILYQLPRHVPAQGVNVGGFYLPQGTTASMSPIAQNRCAEIFGQDAHEWNPTRWLVDRGGEEEQIKAMQKFDFTFGYGSRTCVGKHLALVEIHKFASQLLYQFDVLPVHVGKSWKTTSMWFSYHEGMEVRLKARVH